jgi:hypothetical protein
MKVIEMDKRLIWCALYIICIAGCADHVVFCNNDTLNVTVEKIVYQDKIEYQDRIVTKDKLVYVNVSNCSSVEQMNQRLIRDIKRCERYVDANINFSNCTGYIDLRDNQTRLAGLMDNCTATLKQVNSSLKYCEDRLGACLNKICD